MPVKHLALTIAGAVSLGSYEAGATYEILDAIRQHNDDPETRTKGDFIRIDVLTGASAGGMTASILAQKLLFASNEFVGPSGESSPYDNPLYNTWVLGIDLDHLLDTVDKPLPEGDPATLSLFSSNLIAKIAQTTLAQTDATGQIPLNGGAHNAVDAARGIRLGLALTNLNGVNYQYTMLGGQPFQYTDFSDQMLRHFAVNDRTFAPWGEIREAAVACGAFPVAFRTKDLSRAAADFLPDETLIPFPTDPYTFTYTDGGVLQNQPLGLAKNLVDENDHHIENDNRFYLFVSPSPMDGMQNLALHEANTDMIAIGKRLVDVYMGQATFRDWIQAKSVNDAIDRLDRRAAGLADAIEHEQIDAAILATASQQILTLLFATQPGGESEAQALARLATQYAEEIGSPGAASGLGGAGTQKANAFLYAILALEKAAGLGERDRMQIYGIVTQAEKLAGAGFSAFLGFFDQRYRDHDYDWGRTVAQQLLANDAFQQTGQLGPIRYKPAPIRAIDEELNGLALNQVPRDEVGSLKDGVTDRLNEILKDKLTNPIERYPAQLGADLILKLLIDWEFSRNTQK
jgi:predicted acylesterase/phospholipase RssA